MTLYEFDCEFCESTVRAEAADRLKTRAKRHLRTEHYESVVDVLGGTDGRVTCVNDCSHVFPVEREDAAGLDCPACGHDNFSPLVDRYVYWRIRET